MNCPICKETQQLEGVFIEKGHVSIDYRGGCAHLTEFLMPKCELVAWILGYDGDELYRLSFTEDHSILDIRDHQYIKAENVFKSVVIDLEGTGVAVANDADPEDDYCSPDMLARYH